MDTSSASLPPPPEILPKVTSSPKKSVTFSDEVVLVACAEEDIDDYVPNPLLERIYFQANKNKSEQLSEDSDKECNYDSSDSPPNETSEQTVPCNLCHKKQVDISAVYCADCAFYMSRFQQRS